MALWPDPAQFSTLPYKERLFGIVLVLGTIAHLLFSVGYSGGFSPAEFRFAGVQRNNSAFSGVIPTWSRLCQCWFRTYGEKTHFLGSIPSCGRAAGTLDFKVMGGFHKRGDRCDNRRQRIGRNGPSRFPGNVSRLPETNRPTRNSRKCLEG